MELARVAMARPARAREARVTLRADASAVLDLEEFVDGLDFLHPLERCRAKLAGDEILDNLVRHASPLRDDTIAVRVAHRSDGILLGFFFHSEAFASFAARCGDLEPLFEPLFDPRHRRWRGIGLVMCRNLSLDICMRSGSSCDRIFLRFAVEPRIKTETSPLPSNLVVK